MTVKRIAMALTFRSLLLVCVVGGAASSVTAQTVPASLPVIVTQGEAILKRAPDRAWITVSTEARDPRPAEARRRNAEAMTAVQALLKVAGVGGDAIRTTGFSLSPEMDWNDGRSTLRGYVARNQVEVRIDNLDRLPEVLDAINSPKGIALSISGPRFDLKDEASAQNEALRAAVEIALSRAQALATGARRVLGPILRIDDQNVGPMPKAQPAMMMRSAGAADVATPITPGEIEVRAQVSVTVEMK